MRRAMSDRTTAEQAARNMLERMEIAGAQSFSAGELVEIANLRADRDAHAARSEADAVILTAEEADLCRQWFNALQDLNDSYLTREDVNLACKIHAALG